MFDNNRATEIAAALQLRTAQLQAGDRLPGVRALSSEFHASAATVSAAIAELRALGLVHAEPGRGTFVAALPARTQDPDFSWQSQTLASARVDPDRASRLGGYGTPEHLPLSFGYLAPELVASEELQQAGARAAKSPRGWAMTPPTGSADLRRLFASVYHADPQDVLITPGGQQALAMAIRTLSEPGDSIIVESPSYPGAILAAQSAGLTLAPVPADAEGILLDGLADTLERTRARLIYLQPSFANPTGAVLSPERRAAVIELATIHGAFIIEDDWARHLGLDGETPPPLSRNDPNGHVLTLTTLSKSVSPGLRIGAVVARGPAGERLRAQRPAEDLCVAPLMQETALALLSSPAWPRHLKRLRAALTIRRDALLEALWTGLPELRIPRTPQGGLHVWGRLPHGIDASAVSQAAYADGLIVGDGRHFFVDEPSGQFLRFSYGAATPAQIQSGVSRLARIMERVEHRTS